MCPKDTFSPLRGHLVALVSSGILFGKQSVGTTCLLGFSGKRTAEKSWPAMQRKAAENTPDFSPTLDYHHLHLWDSLQESSPILLSNFPIHVGQ